MRNGCTHGKRAPCCANCRAEIAALEAENKRLRKMAYVTIPLPPGLRWLSRFSAT